MNRITPEKSIFIKEHRQSMQPNEIADSLNISVNQVMSWAKRHNVPFPRRSKFTESDKEYIGNNYLKKSYREIADELGFTERQIRGWINHNLPKKNREFNSDYFSNILLPNRAYWLGFIYADGWIVCDTKRSNYEFGMELQRGDRYMLEFLNDELGGAHKIYDSEFHGIICNNSEESNTETSMLRVYSKELVFDLMRLGIDLRKSESDTFPSVPSECFIDFLRGYFDGDGSLSVDSRRHNLRWDITGTNLACFQNIQAQLNDNFGIHTSIYKHGKKTYKLVCFRKRDVRELLDLLYQQPGSIRLLRKFKIYSSYYGLAA